MNDRIFSLLLICLGSIVSTNAQAVIVEDLYTIELPVADQTTSLRLEVFSEAFRQVIIKVSGSDDALRSPAFERPVEKSARYVKQFRYVVRMDDGVDGFASDRLFLKIDFDQQLVENLLRENNFPIWGRERPGSLLIISYDVNETIRLVSGDTTPRMIDLLDKAALRLGVPVLFPLMDLEDIALLNIADIVSRQYGNIATLADRYSPDVLVIGQIVGRSGQGWSGDWEVQFTDQVFKWEYRNASKQAVIDQVMEHLARILALEYALDDHRRSGQSLLMSVSSMNNIGSLVSVQRYLGALNVVDSVRVTLISDDVVTYELKLRNDAEALQRLIELGEVLEQEELPQVYAQSDSRTQTVLSYSYIDRGTSN